METKSDEVKLDEKVMTKEELEKHKQDMPGNERLVEVAENEYKTIKRMRG